MSASVLLWKEEPVSPLSSADEASLSDATFYQTSLEHFDDVKLETDLAACESKAEFASHILDNLENLMDLDDLIKEEPFLLDEKMLPILEDVEPPRAVPVHLPDLKSEFAKTSDTQYLLHEFETVYDSVEFTHNTLTPPQSPPIDQPMLTNLEPLMVTIYTDGSKSAMYHVPGKQLLQNPYATLPPIEQQSLGYPTVIPQAQQDIDHELAVVDELVRTCVEDMQWSSSSSSSNNSSPGSPADSSNFGDCSSDDPEWVPETIDAASEAPHKTSRKRRSYTKAAPEEKKVRKKEQNKNAATRYRMKKKAEVEVILTEERQLLQENTDLGNQVTDLQREIKYLKGLMRDLFKAKGIIN